VAVPAGLGELVAAENGDRMSLYRTLVEQNNMPPGDLRPLARRALRALAAVLILLVGLARVVLRAHWPSDVLGGIALGLACAGAAVLISASIDRSRAGSASPAPPSPAAPSRTPPAPG